MGAGKNRVPIFGAITFALNVFGTLGILAMVVIVNLDVFGRALFNFPLPGVAEFVGLAIVAIVWAQAADTLRRHRFIRSDIFLNRAAKRYPRLGVVMSVIFDLNGMIITGVIFYFSLPLLTQSIERGYFRGTQGVFTIPVWPVKVMVLVGCAALFIQFLSFFISNVKKLFDGSGNTPWN